MVQALRVAKRAGVGVNLEVNNYPTDPDYDPSTGFALAVAQGVEDSGFPPSDLILQSFLPGNLTPFQGDSYFDDSKYFLPELPEHQQRRRLDRPEPAASTTSRRSGRSARS